jgi:hypothetical protein
MVRAGRHASIGVVPGFLVNKAGHVRYRQQNWMLTGVISDGAGHVLADDQGNLIIEG